MMYMLVCELCGRATPLQMHDGIDVARHVAAFGLAERCEEAGCPSEPRLAGWSQ